MRSLKLHWLFAVTVVLFTTAFSAQAQLSDDEISAILDSAASPEEAAQQLIDNGVPPATVATQLTARGQTPTQVTAALTTAITNTSNAAVRAANPTPAAAATAAATATRTAAPTATNAQIAAGLTAANVNAADATAAVAAAPAAAPPPAAPPAPAAVAAISGSGLLVGEDGQAVVVRNETEQLNAAITFVQQQAKNNPASLSDPNVQRGIANIIGSAISSSTSGSVNSTQFAQTVLNNLTAATQGGGNASDVLNTALNQAIEVVEQQTGVVIPPPPRPVSPT